MIRLSLLLIPGFIALQVAAAAPTIKFNFKDADMSKVIEEYAKASGQKFVVDSNLRGKISLINSGPITLTEAFNQLSSGLAVNGAAISKQDDVMLISHARNIQRNLLEVSSELPPLRPEKMQTLIINLKYATAGELNKELRILTSKDGELVPVTRTNQLIITDWVSNLYRVQKLIKEIDIERESPKTKKSS